MSHLHVLSLILEVRGGEDNSKKDVKERSGHCIVAGFKLGEGRPQPAPTYEFVSSVCIMTDFVLFCT